ncbi:MAG: carboxyl transferase domain-containing protein, partial [candidate division NC10 bacterium]
MQVYATSLDRGSERFRRNRAAMLERLEEIDRQLALARGGGGERYVARHRQRGKLLVRQRIDLLVDRDSPFLELSPLAAWGTDFAVGAAMVSGIGVVSDVECLIMGNDPTVRGGSLNPYTVKKTLRAFEVARANRLPVIQLTESGGADLPTQAEIFVPGGRTFFEITRLSAERIPTLSLVFGSCTAGGAYVPGMSDYTIFIKERSKVFLAGPPLVKMATGEESTDEELGGAEMHAKESGLADYLAADEADAIRIARGIVAHLNWRKHGPGPSLPADPPLHDAEELLGIASVDLREAFDMREIIARVVDGSRIEEFKPLYGRTLVTAWASIHGYPVGLLANNGVLFSEESEKATQFIQLANQHDVPLVFLQNITGYMVGRAYERGGIIKDGAKMINAVTNSKVPHLTVMIGASYGAGNYGMSGRAYDPRFVFSWPSHKIAVMGPPQLAGVLSIVQ